MRVGCAAVVSVLALCALASSARAAPAVVKVFEAKAHEAPAADAPVLHTFPEEAKLSVSEEVTDGWRRVRLPDGRTAFVRDDQITLMTPAAPAPVQPLQDKPPPPVQVVARAGPTIYIKNLDHLADLVKGDAVVHPKADALASRQTAGMGVMVGGALVGGVLMIGSMTFLSSEKCEPLGSSTLCSSDHNLGALIGGATLMGVAALVGLLMLPKRNDILDVVNEWNTRHVDQPFMIDRQPSINQ